MTLLEFNEMDLYEKDRFLFGNKGKNNINFNSFREEGGYKYSLWDCGDFFVEIQHSKVKKKIVNIEGIDLYDKRIDLYIEFVKKHNDEYYDWA